MNRASMSPIQQRTYVIAEVGVNHDGSIIKAKELIDIAKIAGADSVKFQSFRASDLATESTPKVPYQKLHDSNRSHRSMLEALELSHGDQDKLFQYCKLKGIDFISTPYSMKEAIFLNELGVKKFKVASADIVDIPLHNLIASFGKPTIVSTGMSSVAEIIETAEIYKKFGTELILMHCTSEYPTVISHAFLRRISKLRDFNDGAIGFSDHTLGNTAAVMSVGLGCTYIEKHITLDKLLPGPDHAASMNPEEFQNYCNQIRAAESAMGDGTFFLTDQEESMSATSRKTLHLSVDLAQGETIQEADLILMRPGTGLLWRHREKIIGKKAKRNLKRLSPVSENDFE